VEANEDTDVEVGGNAGTGPDAGGTAKSRCKTRSAVMKQLVSLAAAAVSTVKAAKKKKKRRKRKATSPSAVVTPAIPMPRSREVKSEQEEEDKATRSHRSQEIDLRGGRKAPQPRGSGSY
jgi:hypothetical protein